jgi:hypothetical protein
MNLQPAGTDRVHAATGLFDCVTAAGGSIREVVADRGYTQYLAYFAELRARGIASTHRLISWQRTPTAGPAAGTVILDGQLFTDTVPNAERQLPALGFGAADDEQRALEARYARRAVHRYGRLSGPDADGYVRYASPFTTRRLRSTAIPASMRAPRSAPLIDLPGQPADYTRSLTVAPHQLPLWQPTIYGTYAHNISYARRQAVEATNGVLKERFIRLDRTHVRALGTAKRAFLLAFSLAGANHWMWDNHCHQAAADAAGDRRSRRRRRRLAA